MGTPPSRPDRERFLTLFGIVFALGLLACSLPGCHRQPPARQYRLVGQILAVRPDGGEVTIRHEAIEGFMPAMTMPFTLRDRSLAKGRVPGDLVQATLMVSDEEAWLSSLEKTGSASLPQEQAARVPAPEPLRPGDPLPDETLVDQDGRAFRLSDLRGSALLVTFIYTRCPLPEFCPRMDRYFQAVQAAISKGQVTGARLLSISFDPDFDTPAVLKAHAASVGADRRVWLFATAPRPRVEQLAGRLGVSVVRDSSDPASITHNLRTAVVDRQGRIVVILGGNDWTPAQAVSALASVPAS